MSKITDIENLFFYSIISNNHLDTIHLYSTTSFVDFRFTNRTNPLSNSSTISRPTVVRGPKHHLKRLAAPSSWMLDKLSGTYAPRPSNGPHKLREALPLIVSISTQVLQSKTWKGWDNERRRQILGGTRTTHGCMEENGKEESLLELSRMITHQSCMAFLNAVRLAELFTDCLSESAWQLQQISICTRKD